MKIYSVDRFEGNEVVLIGDDRSQKIIKRYQISSEVKETDCLEERGGRFFLNDQETNERKDRVIALQNKLFKK